ncbi:NADH:ubiquinone oxidoreductase [Pararhizobium sp.]|uniref:NADH:ubiquinone oxidoreductase n=1 Tax=Pararhizobium sp. TaxID=1977563 RepID=UPI002717AD8F|nr:NADH:ubiquinone oxidoreductase [Pararhizobium sp.]MDO9415924.1 NADH:ubiquinone oxidoreductase [Pararhizobium sp.]
MDKTAGTSGQGSAVKPGVTGASVPGVHTADPFGLSLWMKDMPAAPLLANPVTAMAAATAVGVGMTRQMTEIMFATMHGVMETIHQASAAKPAETVDLVQPTERVAEPVVTIQEMTKPPVAVENVIKQAAPGKLVKPAVQKAKAVHAEAPDPAVAAAVATDLKLISGIGPKLEQALNRLGILSVADVAGLSVKQAEKIDGQLGLGGRISRDDWVGQAKSLKG